MTIKNEDGSWFALLSLELPDPPLPPPQMPKRPVGVDLGPTSLITLSTGGQMVPPDCYRMTERRLRQQQRRLSRTCRGSHRYERQRRKVARLLHAKVRRQRRWQAHQRSHDLAERYDLVAFEDLDVARLSEGNRLAKGIADAGWGPLRAMTAYKAEERSGRYVEVPTRDTTQTCSSCGKVAEPRLVLEALRYACACGNEMDRDVNAARNVLARGRILLQEELRRITPEVRREEGGPPPGRVGRPVYLRRRVLSVSCEARVGPKVVFEAPRLDLRRAGSIL